MAFQDPPRWAFHLASNLHVHESIDTRHQRLITALMRHALPWGLQGLPAPATPPMDKGGSCAYLSLTRTIKTPVRHASITYWPLAAPGYHQHSDIIHFDFNKNKVSLPQFQHLVHEVLPDYIQAFAAQSLYLTPWEPYVQYQAMNRIRKRPIPTITPVNYWSSALCVESFGRDAAQIAASLENESVPVRWIGDGIYVVFTDEMVPDSNAFDYETKFRPLLELNPERVYRKSFRT